MKTIIEHPCIFTGRIYKVIASLEGYNKWKSGMLIKDALPELSAEDREFLISGISPDGWKMLEEEEYA